MTVKWPWMTRGRSGGRVAVVVGPDDWQVAYANSDGKVVFCRCYEGDDRIQLVSDLVDEYGWAGMSCSVVLHPAYYQLLLTEAPAVLPDEMATALRWKVKELLDYSIDEAAIEYFTLPADAYRGRRNMVYVAALRKASLQSFVAPFEQSGLVVDCIEISELALHKLLARLPQEVGGVGVMSLQAGQGLINLAEDSSLYLCRRLDVGLDSYHSDGRSQLYLESLLLEIQRSLDFYESQLGKGIITRLYYAPAIHELEPIGRYLNEQLALNVAPLPFPEQVSAELEADEVARCLAAVGAALGVVQQEQGAASAAH